MNQTLSSSPKSPQSDDAIYEILTKFRKSIKQINPEANPYMIFENIKKWLNLQVQDSQQAEYLDNIKTEILDKQDKIRDFEQQDNLDDLVINNLVLKLWKLDETSLSERMPEKSSTISPSLPSKGIDLRKFGTKVPFTKRDSGESKTPQTISELEEEKQKVFNKIKEAIEKKEFTEKTDNLYALFYVILDFTKPSIELLEYLFQLIEENQTKILLSTLEGRQYLANLVRLNMIENWKEGALKNYFTQIENQLISDNSYSSFWLLVTYGYILRHSLDEKNKNKLLIPFNCGDEKQKLLSLRLVIKDENNQFKIANKIYQEVFNEKWLKETLINLVSEDETKKNLLDLIKSKNFAEIVKPLNNNKIFSNHVQSILENTIFWADGNEDLTRKILTFIEQAIVKYESENIEWFNKNIIFYRLLGNEKYKITESDFSSLISRLVLTKEGLNDINKSLIRLTTKFKRNPVLIADKILSVTQDSKLIEKLVDYILSSNSIIKDEDDVDKITLSLLENNHKNESKTNKENMPETNINQLLQNIVDNYKQEGLEAIVIINLRKGLVQSLNAKLKSDNQDLFNNLMKKQGTTSSFRQLENMPKSLSDFGTQIKKGILDYGFFMFKKNPEKQEIEFNRQNEDNQDDSNGFIVMYQISFQGISYAICYFANKEAIVGGILDCCENSMRRIKKFIESKMEED